MLQGRAGQSDWSVELEQRANRSSAQEWNCSCAQLAGRASPVLPAARSPRGQFVHSSFANG